VRAQPEDKQSGPGHQQKAKQTRDSLPPAFAQRAVRPRAVRSTEARVLDRLDGPDRPPPRGVYHDGLDSGRRESTCFICPLGPVVWACLLALGTLPTGGPSQPYTSSQSDQRRTCTYSQLYVTPTYEHLYSALHGGVAWARLALPHVSIDTPVTCVRFPVARGTALTTCRRPSVHTHTSSSVEEGRSSVNCVQDSPYVFLRVSSEFC
jgi:hypothetical protein